MHCDAYEQLHRMQDSARLLTSWRGRVVVSFNYDMSCNEGKYAMSIEPIQLLVPIGIFVLGMLVSVSLSNLGIERIVETDKK